MLHSIYYRLGRDYLTTNNTLLEKPDMKKCSTCNEVKELEGFYRDKSKKSGFGSQCKECKKKYYKRPDVRKRYKKYLAEWKKTNYNGSYQKWRYKNDEKYREKCIANSKKWYEENKERVSKTNKLKSQKEGKKTRQKKRFNSHNEYQKWRYKNDEKYREKIKSRSREYQREQDHSKIMKYVRERYKNDPDFRETRKSYDGYIKRIIISQSKGALDKDQIPDRLVDLKRQSLKLKRLIKQKKHD
jgi:hypothetical protein